MTTPCPWYIAGPLLGLLIVGLRMTVNKPLGVLGGYIDIADTATRTGRMAFSGFLLIGVVLGGALFSVITGSYALSWSYGDTASVLPASLPQFIVLPLAGLAMGIGARIAGGCTSGHGLSGISLGSPASLVATMTFFATALILANTFAWLFGELS